MLNNIELGERLRSSLFELTKDIPLNSKEELIYKSVKKLGKLLSTNSSAAYVGLYLYRCSDKSYEFIMKDEIASLPAWFKTDIYTYTKFVNEDNNGDFSKEGMLIYPYQSYGSNQTYILKLDPINKPQALLLLVFEKETKVDSILPVIKDDMEHFLNMLNYYINNNLNNSRNKFLIELSSNLNVANDIPVILSTLHNSLNRATHIIPYSYTHNLILAQDYSVDNDLPIQLLNYNDLDQKGTQAFITGETKFGVKGNKMFLYAPLRGEQGIYGVIEIIIPFVAGLDEDEIKFFSDIADTAGIVIENAILYDHSNHLVSDLKLINDATHKFNANIKLTELVEIVSMQIIDACKATEVGFVYYTDREVGDFEILSGSTSFFDTNEGVLFSKYLVDKMVGSEEAVFNCNIKTEYKDLKYRSLMLIPMRRSETSHGFTVILHEEESFFTFENFKLMQSLIEHSTLAFTNTVLKERLKQAVITDYLTQLYTRSYLDEMITMHMEIDEVGTLLLFDIDDFKNINDTYGHHYGDKVIIQIANIIKNNINNEAVACRWGGEELAVYLPHFTIEEGFTLANKIREKVQNKTEPTVTVSCGVSTWYNERKDSVIDVFLRADNALYKAKEVGKNKVITEKMNKLVSKQNIHFHPSSQRN